MEKDAQYWVEHLQLVPHPEGGYYRQTYKSDESATAAGLPSRYSGERSFCTGIYFLITDDNFSAFHRIKSDEMWHFYAGTGLTVHVLTNDGELNSIQLGNNPEQGEQFQAVVPGGLWFGSEVTRQSGYALVGCTVAPGFEFEDFEMAKRAELLEAFPAQQSIIERLTRS